MVEVTPHLAVRETPARGQRKRTHSVAFVPSDRETRLARNFEVLSRADSQGSDDSRVLAHYEAESPEPEEQFRRGDTDANETVNLTDAVLLLNYLFLSGAPPGCADGADVDDSGELNLSDPIYLLNHLFLSGPPVAEPRDTCGADSTEDELGCSVYPV